MTVTTDPVRDYLTAIDRTPRLTAEEEYALGARIAAGAEARAEPAKMPRAVSNSASSTAQGSATPNSTGCAPRTNRRRARIRRAPATQPPTTASAPAGGAGAHDRGDDKHQSP
ncbi:sigma-70 factor domain-containing protein [Nocardia asteroides]